MALRNNVLFVVLLNCCGFCYAQNCKTDAVLINTKEAYLISVKSNPARKLVPLQKVIPGIAAEIRYATANNFTKVILYHHHALYMREAPANALKQVQDELNRQGLALKIYDAYRPFSVTCHMWKLVPDRRYAANPRKGSNHNRAVAVDLTIIDAKTGKELDMGTAYDNFTDTAHHSFRQLPNQVLANRKMMKTMMRKYGFDIVPDEWWHYQWKDKSRYEVLDLSFDELKDIVK